MTIDELMNGEGLFLTLRITFYALYLEIYFVILAMIKEMRAFTTLKPPRTKPNQKKNTGLCMKPHHKALTRETSNKTQISPKACLQYPAMPNVRGMCVGSVTWVLIINRNREGAFGFMLLSWN